MLSSSERATRLCVWDERKELNYFNAAKAEHIHT